MVWGKFANGAITGAYVVLFNHLQNHSDLYGKKRSELNSEQLKQVQKEIYDMTDEEFDASIELPFDELVNDLKSSPLRKSSKAIADELLSIPLEPESGNYSAVPVVTKVDILKGSVLVSRSKGYNEYYDPNSTVPMSKLNPGINSFVTIDLGSGYEARFVVQYRYFTSN